MPNLNRVILMGTVASDPELESSGRCVFYLHVDRHFRDGEGKQRTTRLDVPCVAFGRTGELVNQYHEKGDPIMVEGRLEGSSERFNVVVERVHFLPRGPGGNPAKISTDYFDRIASEA